MIDPADRAQQDIEIDLDAGVAAVRRRLVAPSLERCADCDAPIEPARRALGGVTRCLDCQQTHEFKQRMTRR